MARKRTYANKKLFVGKTIEKIEAESINCWNLIFTDGTTVEIWAEITGSYGLAGMTAKKIKKENN